MKLVHKASKVTKGNKVFKEIQELQVQLAHREFRAKSVQKDHKVWLEQMVLTALPDPKEFKAKSVHKVYKVIQEQSDPKGIQVKLEQLDRKARLDHRVFKVRLDLRAYKERFGPQGEAGIPGHSGRNWPTR